MDAVAENDRAEIRRRLHVVRKTHYAAPSAGGIGMKCFCGRMGVVNTGERGNDGERSGKAVRMLFVGAPDGRLEKPRRVLVDDDGSAYLYVGFSTTGLFKAVFRLRGNNVEESVCLALEPDMKTVRGGEHPIVPGAKKAKGMPFAAHPFFEAGSIRKIGGKYYYVYSSLLSHELCYAVSDRLAEHNLVNVSASDYDTLLTVAAGAGYIRAEQIPALLAFRDNPADESWISLN